MESNRMSNVLNEALQNLRETVDVDTIIGKPIVQGDIIIIPVSKITFGFGVGGFDKEEGASKNSMFTGGSGGGVNISPIAMLVIMNGEVKVLGMPGSGGDSSDNPYEKLIESIPGIIGSAKKLFKRDDTQS